jgi:16S rRNA (adenine1518-N6/adenine1519-N6)-dimethyltransferase
VLRPVKKEYGQHFLVDENILGVVGRLADLQPTDVVLEIGPGEGVLTRYLAQRVRHVHAVEIDESLAPSLQGMGDNVDVRFGDALRLDLRTDASKLVANLPYNVATPLLVESLDALPRIELWCVMLQREVADRLFARPRTKAYGAVSVLVQLVCERTGFHPVSRTVFRPPPNVDSALVAFRRIGLPHDFVRIKRVVAAAFAHRRKTLPNSLELSGLSARVDAVAALEAIGREPTTRAEALTPADFVALAEALRLRTLLPAARIKLTGTASVRAGFPADDLDLVVVTDDVEAAADVLVREYPPLYRDEWRDDWAAFRVDAHPQVDVVVTRVGTLAHAHHVRAWERLADDPALLAEYRIAKLDATRKGEFFDRVVETFWNE